MHRHYGGIPDGVPLVMFVKMIEQGFTWDVENEIKPIWYLRVIKDALKGESTTISVKDMIDEAKKAQPLRSGDDITSDFMTLIEREGVKNG